MKILILIDVVGWAFEFVARGIQKYSKHECVIKCWRDVDTRTDSNFDVLFCMNDSVWDAIGLKRRSFEAMPNMRKCVGIRGEQMPSDRILNGWTIGAVNQKIYDELMKTPNLPVKGIYLTRNGVDVDIFKPIDRPENRFIVGWAGNPEQRLKRYYLLRDLNFLLAIQSKWGNQYFVPNRSRDEMIEFYKKINCFVNVSEHEGMPQSILEAAATKLPIVSTMAGGIPEFVDAEWLVPVNPEREAMQQMNSKLQLLMENTSLRKQVGEQNLQKVLNSWRWEIVVKQYDAMFEST